MTATSLSVSWANISTNIVKVNRDNIILPKSYIFLNGHQIKIGGDLAFTARAINKSFPKTHIKAEVVNNDKGSKVLTLIAPKGKVTNIVDPTGVFQKLGITNRNINHSYVNVIEKSGNKGRFTYHRYQVVKQDIKYLQMTEDNREVTPRRRTRTSIIDPSLVAPPSVLVEAPNNNNQAREEQRVAEVSIPERHDPLLAQEIKEPEESMASEVDLAVQRLKMEESRSRIQQARRDAHLVESGHYADNIISAVLTANNLDAPTSPESFRNAMVTRLSKTPLGLFRNRVRAEVLAENIAKKISELREKQGTLAYILSFGSKEKLTISSTNLNRAIEEGITIGLRILRR